MKSLITIGWNNLWRLRQRTLFTIGIVLCAVLVAMVLLSLLKVLFYFSN